MFETKFGQNKIKTYNQPTDPTNSRSLIPHLVSVVGFEDIETPRNHKELSDENNTY
jgi:hypothetical protein